MSARRRLSAAAAILAIGLVAAVARAQDARGPGEATLNFRGRGAAVGIGFLWGGSTLEFQGRTYPVRVDGFVLGAVGSVSVEAVGQVSGLSQVEDLNGDFTALGTGGAFGLGGSKLVMRNEKGVRIEMDAKTSGVQLGIGPRGVTLSVGEAGGPPADASARLPETLGFGEMKLGPLSLRPTLNAQVFASASQNAGFDGQWSFGDFDQVGQWFEHSNELGLNGRYDLGEYGALRARVSGVYSLTAAGPDGALSNGTEKFSNDYTLESGYLAWQSGDLFPALGHNAIELSGGNQNYQVFDGLLFWDGGQDNGDRGANWLSPRKAFRETGILRLNVKGLTLEGVHLKYNDDPKTHTRIVAGRAEYATDDWWMKHLKLGVMYFDIYDSDNAARDDMDGIYLYHEATPLPSLPDLSYTASFVREHNSESSGLSEAYAWYASPSYQISCLPWKPQIFYRYASFSGGGTSGFDPLFTGLTGWGTWFQGELLGEFALSDSNLISHQVRAKLQLTDTVTTNLIYYRFKLDDKDQGFGVTPSHVESPALADELDFIVDVALTNWWSITAAFTWADPNEAFRQAVGNNSTWFNGYLYMNFNF